MSAFDPDFDQLPDSIAIFPLPGVLLLPRGYLPLNIFEPRYLNMVADALARDRMFAMVQPNPAVPEVDGVEPEVFQTACAGRVVQFEETEDGRLIITLKGICRLKIREELAPQEGFRRVAADWSAFRNDLVAEEDGLPGRDELLAGLESFFEREQMRIDWSSLKNTSDERLVNTLSMICPFEPSEKQALLEAPTLADRMVTLNTLVQMASAGGGEPVARQ